MSATGTEMSWARVWPSTRSASEIEFADPPERLGLRLIGRDHRVGNELLAERVGQTALELGGDVGRRIGGGRFDQCMPRVRVGERIARAGDVPEHELERILGHELEALDARGALLKKAQQGQRIRRRGNSRPGDGARRDRRHEAQGDRGDYA